MIRLAVRVSRERAEIVLAELLELAPAGVEESAPSPDLIEYAVYGAPGELPTLPELNALAGDALVEISTSELPDDWSKRWRAFHRPVLVPAVAPSVPALVVRPPWESASEDTGVMEIVIDPGQAFGTGGHATTRMCLELLLELAAAEPSRGPVLDVGTGSGVLAIAAARLGYEPILALDLERESVLAARENAAVNGVELDVRRADLRREPLPAGPGVVVLANLLRPLLLELPEALVCPPAHLIAGGLLAHEADEVAGALARRLGLAERRRTGDGEWAALWLAS
jgi:ribosomal protein L11 methyltransferase